MTEDASTPAKSPAPSKPANRPVARDTAGPPPFGGALLASLSRRDRPGTDDPYQSGQRLWPD